jgi:hypothetical protein
MRQRFSFGGCGAHRVAGHCEAPLRAFSFRVLFFYHPLVYFQMRFLDESVVSDVS